MLPLLLLSCDNGFHALAYQLGLPLVEPGNFGVVELLHVVQGLQYNERFELRECECVGNHAGASKRAPQSGQNRVRVYATCPHAGQVCQELPEASVWKIQCPVFGSCELAGFNFFNLSRIAQ